MNKIIFVFFLFLISINCKSQTVEIPDIIPDRPGMTTGPFIVLPKKFQIETGFLYEKNMEDNTLGETILYNSTLLRFGINKNAEIRLQTDFAKVKTDSLNITGFNPLTIGTKILISESKGAIPQTSFLFNLTLPWVGRKEFRPANPAPSLFLLFENDIKKWNICYNFGLQFDGESPAPSEFAGLCIAYNFTDKLSFFIENYNWFCGKTKPENYMDIGCAYIIAKNIQLDLSGNMNLQDIKHYYMVSFGVSWRIIRNKQRM